MAKRSSQQNKSATWLALVVGNTRLHWGYFYQNRLIGAWHTPHLTQTTLQQLQTAHFRAAAWQTLIGKSATARSTTNRASPSKAKAPSKIVPPSEIWIASAVPAQMALWLTPTSHESLAANGCSVHEVERSHIPLTHLYSSLGIDRAINLLGAGQLSGWPIIVIDGGTALTFTAGTRHNGKPRFYGGAILPGLRLQREALTHKTAVLGAHIPKEAQTAPTLPTRWAMDTESAIASGLIYSITATLTDYLTDWWGQFPNGKVILTGGDALLLHHYLQQRTPEVASRVLINHDLMFYGMQAYRQALMTAAIIER